MIRIDYKPCYAIGVGNSCTVLKHLPSRFDVLYLSRLIGVPFERVHVKFLGCIGIKTYINIPF